MSDFTKGKWRYSLYETKANKHKRIQIISYVGLSEGIIKHLATLSGTDAEAHANARLIAAAPEMYELLNALIHQEYDNTVTTVLISEAQKLLAHIDGDANVETKEPEA